jgi:hypothetical protein
VSARRPAKRLLIAPVLLLAGVLALVVWVPSQTERPVRAAEVGPLLLDVPVEEDCVRGIDADVELEPIVTDQLRVTSAAVVSCPTRFDGEIVTYVGELVGDLLHRDGGAWVLVNDDDYALAVGPLPTHRDHRGTNSGLSVWLPDEHLDQVTGLGRPGRRGDVVQIEGHIERTDPDDGGGLTLRATEIEVLRPSERFEDPTDLPQLLLAVTALVVSAILWIARRRAEPR